METVLLVLLLGTWGGIFWVYRRVTREIDDLARERVEQTETQASLARMVTQLQVAADELAQAMSARTGRLQALLDQADRRAADLEAALKRVQQAQVQARFDIQRHGSRDSRDNRDNWDSRDSRDNRDSRDHQDATEVGHVADAEAHGNAHNGTDDEVRRLAALGLSPAEIAQRTHRGREEIRLLLQLMPARGTTATATTTATTTTPTTALTNEGTTR